MTQQPQDSPFETHLDNVLRLTNTAMAIHQVTHPGCTDTTHLTQLDRQRAQAAINAIHHYDSHQQP